MPFNLIEKLKQALPGWRTRLEKSGVHSSYAMIIASALWPVAAAAQAGDWSALTALGAALGSGVGSELIAQQIQKWKDEADGARQIAALPTDDPLREHLDVLLQRLEAFTAVRDALPDSDKQWFQETLRGELSRLGNLNKFELQIGAMMIASRDIIINAYSSAPPRNDAEAITAYLETLIRTCAPLRLKAIDQGAMRADKQPLGLTSVYVDLNLDLRIPQKLAFPDYLKKLQSAREQTREAVQPERGETRLVPALEALAHHPKMVLLGRPGSGKSTLSTYLALSLAEAALGHAAALKRLGRWWKHGSLLPMPVVLREFAATLPADLDRGRAKHLWDFIATDLANSGHGEATGAALRQAAEARGALFLLDGLDEAGDESRRARVLEAVDEFTRTASAKCRFLLTSRPYAWEEATAPAADSATKLQVPRLDALPPAYRLADFEPEQIQEFIQHWYHAIAALGWIGAGEAKEKTANLVGAVHREDLATLARNPLLLTLMATLHSNRTRLPDDRADLYNEVVELLLQRWNETIGADRGLLDALKIQSLKLGNLREQIEQLAFEAHAANVGKEGTADIAEGDLLTAFCPLLGGSRDKAALVVAYIEKRAGLLLGQGPRERQRQFTFPHRTFQEYLAACYLARQPDFRTRAVDLARANPAHWREVLTLAARKASADAGVPVADALVHGERFEAWSQHQTPEEPDWRGAMLAAEQLLEIGLASVASREERCIVRDRVAGWLAALLAKEGLPARDRDHAGNLLARLGDLRPGVGLKHGVPDIVFEELQFPAGEFALAANGQKVKISQPYRLSRYPVTVAQFQTFVAAGGYEDDHSDEATQRLTRWWTPGGLTWKRENDIAGPGGLRPGLPDAEPSARGSELV